MNENYNMVVVRDSAILTTSYVASTVLGPTVVNPQHNKSVRFFVEITIGSLTSVEVKVEGSPDGTAYSKLHGPTEYSFTASGTYIVAVPAFAPYVKASVKGTGTVTDSLVKMTAICSDTPFIPGEYDTLGNLYTRESYAPAAEDNSNGVIAYVRKPLAVATYAPTLYAPLTQVTKNVIKATPGNVFSVYVTNDNAAVRYLQLHNKATAPAAGEAPLYVFKIPAGTANNPGTLTLDEAFFARGGAHFTTGIGFAVSTTFATFTDSATASEHIINVQYI